MATTLKPMNIGRRRVQKGTPLLLEAKGAVRLELTKIDGGQVARFRIPRGGLEVQSTGRFGGSADSAEWPLEIGDEMTVPRLGTRIILETIDEDMVLVKVARE